SAGRDAPDYASAIDLLPELGVLPSEFAARLRGIAGFRNVRRPRISGRRPPTATPTPERGTRRLCRICAPRRGLHRPRLRRADGRMRYSWFAPAPPASSGSRGNPPPRTPRTGDADMSDTPTFGRYAEIPLDRMTAEQQNGYRFLVEGPRGRLPGPYKVWVDNPRLLRAAAPLGEHFTPGKSSLSEREREIAVIVITSKWHSAYPAAAHEKRGKEV